MSGIERELINVTGVKEFDISTMPRDNFLKDVATATDKLPDDDWKKLSDPAQAWANKAADALRKGFDVPDFVNGKDTSPTKVTATKKTKKAQPKAAVKKKATGKKVKKAPAKPKPKVKAVAKPVGAQALIKKHVIRNPSITTDEVLAKLNKAGFHPTKFAVSTIRTGTRQTLKIIQEEGVDVRKLEL